MSQIRQEHDLKFEADTLAQSTKLIIVRLTTVIFTYVVVIHALFECTPIIRYNNISELLKLRN